MNKFSELLDSKDLLNKPLIIESGTKELLYLLGEALIKVIGRYGIQGPEGYKSAVVLPPTKGSSEAYRQIYEQGSATVVRGLL